MNESNIQRVKEKSGGWHIESEKLLFRGFSLSDVGVYVCERRVGRETPTSKKINVTMKGKSVITLSGVSLLLYSFINISRF